MKTLREIIRKRIRTLFKLAEFEKDEKLRKRYVELAFKLSKRNRVRIDKHLKRRFCKRCFTLWDSGTLRVRIKKRPERGIEYKCLVCGRVYFFPNRRRGKGSKQ